MQLFREEFFPYQGQASTKPPASRIDWVVSAEQPPTRLPDDLKRVDIVVERAPKERYQSDVVLFVEAKRASAATDEIERAELQAYRAGLEYIYQLPKARPVWTMTCVGPTVRLWICDKGEDYLMPWVPPTDGLSAASEYLDVLRHPVSILRAFKHIRDNPIPRPEDMTQPPSPRPTNVTLPPAWLDSSSSAPSRMIPASSYQASSGPSSAPPPRSAPERRSAQTDVPPGSGRVTVRDVAQYGQIPLDQKYWKQVQMLGSLGKHGGSFTVRMDGEEFRTPTTGWVRQLYIEEVADGGALAHDAFVRVMKERQIVIYCLDKDL